MQLRKYQLLVALFGVNILMGQIPEDNKLPNYETEAIEEVASIQINKAQSLVPTLPFFRLGSDEFVKVDFDLLQEDAEQLVYTVRHFDADWSLSDIRYDEYVYGFDYEEILTYEFSFQTHQNYVHYSFTLPNSNFEFLKSGNYMLYVFSKDRDF